MVTKDQVITAIREDSEDRLTINLMLTEQCNFRCRHCFYSCGPDSKKGYIKANIYSAVLDQIFAISDEIEHENVTVNLIGGEPTLNMLEFKKALTVVFRWLREEYIQGLEMTTNGWWLHDEKTTTEFFSVISEVVSESYLGIDNGFTIRVSNDRWHDEFRPDWMKSCGNVTQTRDRLKYALSDVWDNYLFLPPESLLCDSCEADFKPEWVADGDDCHMKGCGGTICYEEGELLTDYLLPNPEESTEHEGWIYVENNNSDPSLIMPLGRGEGIGSSDKCRTVGFGCNARYGGYLTYRPDGTLSDICCSGSDFPAGTCHDDPFELLAMAMDFGKHQQSCFGCHEDAKAWLEDNASKYQEGK